VEKEVSKYSLEAGWIDEDFGVCYTSLPACLHWWKADSWKISEVYYNNISTG